MFPVRVRAWGDELLDRVPVWRCGVVLRMILSAGWVCSRGTGGYWSGLVSAGRERENDNR